MAKPLIVLALLIILADAVFVFTATRPAGSVAAWQPQIAATFGGLIARPLTPGDLDVQSGGCRIDGTALTAPAGQWCSLGIAVSDQRLRRGTLRVSRGPVRIQTAPSGYGGPARTLAAGERYDLNIEREGETVSLSCRDSEACRLILEAPR